MRFALTLLLGHAAANHTITGRRTTKCPAVETRCLVRCEMDGAENRLNGHIYSHKEMVRCLDRCEDDFCPPPPVEEDERRRRLKRKRRSSSLRAWPPVTRRALVAVPRENAVFLSWRLLDRDFENETLKTTFAVYRRLKGKWVELAKVPASTYLDTTATGEVEYVIETAGGERSDIARPSEGPYVLLAGPGTPPISNALFADTDGDGEIEAVIWKKMSGTYGIAVIDFDEDEEMRSFLNDMGGRQTKEKNERGWLVIEGVRGKALKEAPGSETSLWSRPRAAGDVDGDGREEIWTTAFVDGVCQYVLLKDTGTKLEMIAHVESPYPLCDGADNSRHDCFVANLDGDPSRLSVGIMGGRHAPWHIFVFDFNGTALVPRWDAPADKRRRRRANLQTSHNAAIVDVDCDGKDEIIAGATAIDDDGTLLWDANEWFGKSAHVDGVVVDDVDPRSPGFEVVLFSETGPEYGVYRAADGAPIFEGVAPGYHIQWTVAVNVSGSAFLDIVGTYGGHFVDGGFAVTTRSKDKRPFPFPDWPREAHNWFPIDWDSGHETAIFGFCLKNFSKLGGCEAIPSGSRPRIFGVDKEVFRVNEGVVRTVTNAVDVVGDHREELVVQMTDGSVRAYLNTAVPQSRKPTKLLDYHYRRFLAHAAFPSHVAALGDRCQNLDPFQEDPVRFVDTGADVSALRTELRVLRRAFVREKSTSNQHRLRTLRAQAIAVKRELLLARARIDLRRHIANISQSDTLALHDLSNTADYDISDDDDLDLPLLQPFEQSCSRKRFGFCFGRSTKVGILIHEEDLALEAALVSQKKKHSRHQRRRRRRRRIY